MNYFIKIYCVIILFITIIFISFNVNMCYAQQLSNIESPIPIPLLTLKRMYHNYYDLLKNNKFNNYFTTNEKKKMIEFFEKDSKSSRKKTGLDQTTVLAPTNNDGQKSELSSSFLESWINPYHAQNPNCGNSESYDMTIDNSGNVYVTGFSEKIQGELNADYATIKYDQSGVEQWVALYNGPADFSDGATAIAVDNFGNVYVTGFSYNVGTEFDYVTIKYDQFGVEQWIARYNGPGNNWDWAMDIIVDDYGNVYVTGASDSYEDGDSLEANYDFATIKYNSSGVEQWIARYDGPSKFNDGAIAMSFIESDNICVTGYSYVIGERWDYLTIKYSSSGDEQWTARYNGPANGWDEANDLIVDESNNIYITGFSVGTTTSSDLATIKYNAAGVEQWVARYDGPGHRADRGRGIALDRFGDVYVTGASTGENADFDYTTIKYNTSGNMQWISRYDGLASGFDWADDICVDNSGNIYITGLSEGINTQFDYVTIKYDASGLEQWVARYNGLYNKDDKARVIAADGAGSVYVSGYSEVRDYATYLTVKYFDISTDVPTESQTITNDFQLDQNYPNPFNPKTTICYQMPVDGYVELSIYSVLGEKIETLVSKQQSAGNYKVEWDASSRQGHLAGGVYIYQLHTEEYTFSNKLLLLK